MFLHVMSEVTTIPEGLVNTALGMGTVFAVLILISFIIYLLKFIPMLLSGDRNKKAAVQKTAPAAKEVRMPDKKPAAVKAGSADDSQIVAVIAAAVAAQMEEETGVPVAADGLCIRSIKKRVFSL